MIINIRQEIPTDYNIVYTLTESAFKKMPHAEGDEQDLVVKLRKSNGFIPELSLVAEVDGLIIGHILFTINSVETVKGSIPILILAPVSILPEYQNKGIGSLLIRKGHEIAVKLGYKAVFLVGHEKYYPRFGYKPASTWGIKCPIEAPDECVMAIELVPGALSSVSGTVKFLDAFGC